MAFRSNQPITGRDFFFNPAGDNDLSGTSDENPLADPDTAIINVNALAVPPDASNPASINASVSGTYTNGLVIPQFVTCKASSASVLTFDPVAVQCMGRHEVEWGSLLNFSTDGICVLIDGETRVAVEANAVAPIGTDGVGFDVRGVCNEVFVQMRLGELQGPGSTMFKHTAESDVPIGYNIRQVEFFGANQTLFEFNPPNSADQANITISSCQEDPSSTTTDSMIFQIMNGRLVAQAQVLQAENLASVASGAELSLECQIAFGDVQLNSGSDAIINAGLLVGDITVDAGAILTCVINRYSGTLTNNGTINGIINGVRFGNWIVNILDTITDETDTSKVLFPDGSGGVEWIPPVTTFGDLFVTGNAALTDYTQNIYRDIDTNNGFALGGCNSGFDLDDSDAGTLELTDASFTGTFFLTASFSPTSSKTYEFRVVKDTGSGFAVLPEDIVYQVNEGNSAPTTVVVNVALSMSIGDKVKVQSRNIDGDDDATWVTVTICMAPKANNYIN